MATITPRPVTTLDFDLLKADLIDYIKSNPTFSDYNFEGSALNAIADLLAYNTHNLGYYANMLHSETFLDSAQKRSSVVSRAKELGYCPRSTICSTAFLDITVIGGTGPFYINRGTTFTSSNDNGSYSFLTTDDLVSSVSGIDQKFTAVKVVNGLYATNTFKMDPLTSVRSIFKIPNKNIDTTTLRVFVRDSISSIERTQYFRAENVYESLPTNKSFFLQESYDGFFQIYFGQDVLGVQPGSGSIIEIDYFVSTDLDQADGCRTFSFTGSIGTSTGLNLLTTQVSFGGSDKESINSIKLNAVKSLSAKERAVTASDYQLVLSEQFPFVKSVAVWGGEDNIPPVYGKVFISIQPVSGYTISDSVKREIIIPALKKQSLVTVIPELIDPNYVSLEFEIGAKINPNKTTTSISDLTEAIKAEVRSYVDTVSFFNTDLLQSTLVSSILTLDPGIISVQIDKRIGFRFSPLNGIETTFKNILNNPIVPGSIVSTKFNIVYDGSIIQVQIKESSTSGTLGLFDNEGTLISQVGTVDLTTGSFSFTISLYSYISGNRFIQLYCVPVNQDILTARNQIVTLNSPIEDSTIGLLSNLVVNTEIYTR